jgi:hypothetical protein
MNNASNMTNNAEKSAQASINDTYVHSADEYGSINTDTIIWKKDPSCVWSPTIFISGESGVGINCGGNCIVLPIEKWHELGNEYFDAPVHKPVESDGISCHTHDCGYTVTGRPCNCSCPAGDTEEFRDELEGISPTTNSCTNSVNPTSSEPISRDGLTPLLAELEDELDRSQEDLQRLSLITHKFWKATAPNGGCVNIPLLKEAITEYDGYRKGAE